MVEVVARAFRSQLGFPGVRDRIVELVVIEVVTGQRTGGHADLEIIMDLPGPVKAALLKLGRLTPTSGGVMHITQVVEHTVGGTLLADPGMELQRTIAVVDRAREVANGAGGNAECHMGVGNAKQTFAVHGRVEGALKIIVGLFELPEGVAGTAEIGQYPRAKAGVGVLAAIEPSKRAEVGLRRRSELLLLLDHVTQVGVDRRAELRIIRRCRGGRDLERAQRVAQAAQCVQSESLNPVQLGALIGGIRKAEAFVDQGEGTLGLVRFDRQFGALAQIGQLMWRPVTGEMTQREAKALGHHPELGEGRGPAGALDLADEAFGCQTSRQLFLGQPAGESRLPKTVADRVHRMLLSIASLNPLGKSILTPN